MGNNHYIALLSKSGNPEAEDERLYMDMLCFLDDRHIPVQVLGDDRMPAWLERHLWWANAFYFFKLLFAPRAVVLVDFKLSPKVGMAVFLARWFRKHRLIVSVFQPRADAAGWLRNGVLRFRAWACLAVAHRILVHSEECAAWVQDTAAGVGHKVRYFAAHQSNLGEEGAWDTSWWPLHGFKPRWHRRRHFEVRMNMRVSIN